MTEETAGTPKEAARTPIQDCQPHLCIADLLIRQNCALRHELEMLTNAGVIECMVRNPAVNERIGELEREVAALTEQLKGEKAKILAPANTDWGRGMLAERAALTAERDRVVNSHKVLMAEADKRLEAAEAQRDELQKRIGYPTVPSDKSFINPCKKEFFDKVVAELNLDTSDAFTRVLANAFALADQRDTPKAELATLEADARRYRWLRERYSASDMNYRDFGKGQTGRPVAIFSVTNPWPFSFDYEAAMKLLDAAIDSALAAKSTEQNNQEATVPREGEGG